MSPLDDEVRDWQRAARYRQFSILLGEDETVTRLRALAPEMEQRLETFRQPVASAEERRHPRI